MALQQSRDSECELREQRDVMREDLLRAARAEASASAERIAVLEASRCSAHEAASQEQRRWAVELAQAAEALERSRVSECELR